MKVGTKLTEMRKSILVVDKKGKTRPMTQGELALRCGLDVQTISRLERDITEPTLETAAALVRGLRLSSIDDLCELPASSLGTPFEFADQLRTKALAAQQGDQAALKDLVEMTRRLVEASGLTPVPPRPAARRAARRKR